MLRGKYLVENHNGLEKQMYSTEKLFWKRLENLEKAIKEAKNIDFKAVWTDKLRELMKKLPKRLIN